MKLFALIIIVSLSPMAAAASDADGGYWYIKKEWSFPTLASAIQDAKSKNELTQHLELKGNSKSQDGASVWLLAVPETKPLAPAAGEYYDPNIGSFRCESGGFICSSIGDAAAIVRKHIEWVQKQCVVSGPTYSGGFSFDRWIINQIGIPGGGHVYQSFSGKSIEFEVVGRNTSGQCFINGAYSYARPVKLYRPFICPEGYSVRVYDNGQRAECRARLEIEIHGPVEPACDATTGNPCSILTGDKSDTDLDYRTDELYFERIYNSTQMN